MVRNHPIQGGWKAMIICPKHTLERVVNLLNILCAKTKHPYLENAEGINTNINNTNYIKTLGGLKHGWSR